MSLSNVQYELIKRSYEERQLQNHRALENRRKEIYAAIPAYKDLEDAISSISVSQGKKMLEGDDGALAELKKIIRDLSAQKKLLLEKNGFPANYLEPVYQCQDCEDTGYINNKKCHCFRQAMIKMLYEQSNIQEMLEKENFSTLSEQFYQGEDLLHFQRAVSTCKEFVSDFSNRFQNLFFYGTVGTGKSFLSGCIAKELIERGQSVIYFSAAQLFESLSVNPYDFKNKEDLYNLYEDIYNCDLLIIDDLGTEATRASVSSQLFSCLNERQLRQKSSIISTNLSLEEIRSRYSDRIFSRITSNYELCKLTGPDIRMYKKLINH
ncbi:MAG: ATP-binding protein [Lachnospiraceae bacterium]|nr:ATP-binding protein [Lachnospiraceae bacterium]